MAKSPVIGAAVGTCLVWWGASLVAFFATGHGWTDGDWITECLTKASAVVGGFCSGGVVTACFVFLARRWRATALQGDNVRGVTCSIGPLPVFLNPPAQAESLPDPDALRLPGSENDRDGKVDRNWLAKWEAEYARDYPQHVRLMHAIARVINAKPTLPAACKRVVQRRINPEYNPSERNHGGHTLVEHSWVCASVGVWLSKNRWVYGGMMIRPMNSQQLGGFIAKETPSYKVQPFDPLIALVCFVHDIGKLETFDVDRAGNVTSLSYEHDSVGAHMLARMEEFWELPPQDRMTLTLVIGHYHKPGQMPLKTDKVSPHQAVAFSDRAMSLLELLIKADNEAASIEHPKTSEASKATTIVEDEYRSLLWSSFKDLLNESQRIHHENTKFRIGQKNANRDGPFITLKENELRIALLEKMQLKMTVKSEVAASGSVQLTEDLLQLLDEKECLIKEWNGLAAAARDAIFKVNFMGKDKQKFGEVIATWQYAILIRPEAYFPRLAAMQDAASMPMVECLASTSQMGQPKASNAKRVLSVTDGFVLDSEGVPKIAEGTRSGSRRPKTTVTDAVRSDAGVEDRTSSALDDERDQGNDGRVRTSVIDDVFASADEPAKSAVPTTGPSAIETLQQVLKKGASIDQTIERLDGSVKIPTPAVRDEVPTTRDSDLMVDAARLASQLVKQLAMLDRMTAAERIAPKTWEDGRLAYGMDAVRSVDPAHGTWLTEPLARRLAVAQKLGASAPVCLTVNRAGVTLLLVNRQAVAKALATSASNGPAKVH